MARQTTRSRARVFSVTLAWVLGAAGWSGITQAAEPAPVASGLWEVQMLALFQPDPQPGAANWPGLPDKARARVYRICLDAPRARAPMSLPRPPSGAERVVSDETTVLVRDGRGDAPSVESLYRRLSEREFEGSQTVAATAGAEMTLQYRSVFVQRDCDGVRPTAVSNFGEP